LKKTPLPVNTVPAGKENEAGSEQASDKSPKSSDKGSDNNESNDTEGNTTVSSTHYPSKVMPQLMFYIP